jgi:hypothetical protein
MITAFKAPLLERAPRQLCSSGRTRTAHRLRGLIMASSVQGGGCRQLLSCMQALHPLAGPGGWCEEELPDEKKEFEFRPGVLGSVVLPQL